MTSLALAINDLFLHHRQSLIQTIYRIFGCPQTAEDLAHEAYLKMLHVSTIQKINQPRPFLYQTARNLALDHLRALPVSLTGSDSALLGFLATVNPTPGYAKLIRQDRHCVLKVQARVDPRQADVNAIYAALEERDLKDLKQRFPGLNVSIGQDWREQEVMAETLGLNTLIALVVIYALIAVPFRSYLKPLIFLLAAPVAWCGAMLAHWLAGLPLSVESLVGMIAVSGVVVNDSLVLLDYIRERGDSIYWQIFGAD